MKTLSENSAEIKLELFRFIDTLTEDKLQYFYNFLILKQQDELTDFWDFLSDWEKEDINAGLVDLDNGRFKDINEVLAKY